MGRLVVLLAAIATIAACGGGGKDPAVCRREAAELGTLLAMMDHEVPSFYAGDVTLVTRTDLPATKIARGPSLTVAKDGVSFEGQRLDAEAAAERIALARMQAGEWASATGADAELVYLVIDENAAWSDVARALRVAHESGFRRPALAFTRPPVPVTRPPRSKIDDDLDALMTSEDPANRATELARMVEKLVKGCPAIQRAFGAIAADDGASKAETLIRAIEPALVECGCNVNMRSFASVMFRLLYIEKPQSSFRVTLDPAAAAITLPPSTPWRDAQARFAPDARVWVNAP